MDSTLQARARRCAEAEHRVFDVIVVGGGIHGACIARDAALRGLSTLLLEARDFGSMTSSVSSKLIHGGIRYLENFDFPLVFEALRERDILVQTAGELVRPLPFLYPILPKMARSSWQIRAGLVIYDALAAMGRLMSGFRTTAFPGHRRLAAEDEYFHFAKSKGLQFSGGYIYYDGQVDDARLVIQNILDAEMSGALALNYAKVESMVAASETARGDARWTLSWKCGLTGATFSSDARFIINSCGPFVKDLIPQDMNISAAVIGGSDLCYSRGTHLLFSKPWNGPGLILPTGEPTRYYFVLPLFNPGQPVTLVGTTDRLLGESESDPQPTKDEIHELLSYLLRDLPQAGLNKTTLYQAFAGVRTLVMDQRKGVSRISRQHKWFSGPRYLALLGGKYTNARQTAEGAVTRVQRVLGRSANIRRGKSTRTRLLPRYEAWSRGAELKLVRQAILSEQAFTPEDVLRRRLSLALLPGGGADQLETVVTQLRQLTGRDPNEIANEATSYYIRWVEFPFRLLI